MITLEEMIKKQSENGEIVLPKQEEDRINRVVSYMDDQRFKDVMQQASHSGWWDSGSFRYQNVNRNVISQLKRDVLFLMTQALCKNFAGPGLGIGGTPIPGVLHVNVGEQGTCDVVVDSHKLPFEDDSVAFIISSHTLEHIFVPNSDNPIREILLEWIRVIHKGSMIAITMPSKKYFLHENRKDLSPHDVAWNEITPEELKVTLDQLSDKVELLMFNTPMLENRFDFDILLRKI